MELSLGFFDLFVGFGFCVAACAFHMKKRHQLMRIRLVSILCYITYFIGNGAYAGAFGASIAWLGTLVQAVVPQRLLKKTLYWRAGVAVFLACCGMAVFSNESAAIYPMIGVIIARMSEVQSCVQRVRVGYLLSQTMWWVYAIETGFLPYVMTETVLIASNMLAIWRHEQELKKTRLLPLKVA